MVKSKLLSCSSCGHGELFFDNLIWLSTEEAAEYLRVSIGSIKNLVYRGVLSPRKLGRLNRFNREEIDRLLETSLKTGGA